MSRKEMKLGKTPAANRAMLTIKQVGSIERVKQMVKMQGSV